MSKKGDYLEGRDGGRRLPASGRPIPAPDLPLPPEPVTVRVASVEQLPASFDDGEWRTILTKNDPFAVLFLDAENWRSLTVDMVKRHHELLSTFWKKKLMAMRSGSRSQILRKYGGPDQSEYLVESFPQILNDAYEELASEEKIRAAGVRLERLRTDAALAEIARRLEFFLVDGELTPLEARSLFQESARLGLTDQVTAQFIAAKLTERAAQPMARPRGTLLKDQLCSVTWSVSPPVHTITWKVIAVLAFAFAVVVVIALLLMGALRDSAPAPSRRIPANSTTEPLLTEKIQPQPPAGVLERAAPPPAAARSSLPPDADSKSEADLQAERDAGAAEMQRKSVSDEREAAKAAHVEIERSLPALRDRLAENRLDDVETESERLMTLAARHALTDDITTVREIASAARERKVDEKVEQERRARYVAASSQIKQLTDSGKYPEAISLSTEVLKDPLLPADLREQILESQNKARTDLKRIMSSAVVKGGEVKPAKKH